MRNEPAAAAPAEDTADATADGAHDTVAPTPPLLLLAGDDQAVCTDEACAPAEGLWS
jgi:hypothetical protein